MVLLSAHNIHWGDPPKPITHVSLYEDMTPEQQELLSRKCNKRDLYLAQLQTTAIGAAFSGKFSPLDLIDGPINTDAKDGELPTNNLKPSQRREKFWGDWGWPIEQLYQFAIERGYDVELYFDEAELKQLRKNFDEKEGKP